MLQIQISSQAPFCTPRASQGVIFEPKTHLDGAPKPNTSIISIILNHKREIKWLMYFLVGIPMKF